MRVSDGGEPADGIGQHGGLQHGLHLRRRRTACRHSPRPGTRPAAAGPARSTAARRAGACSVRMVRAKRRRRSACSTCRLAGFGRQAASWRQPFRGGGRCIRAAADTVPPRALPRPRAPRAAAPRRAAAVRAAAASGAGRAMARTGRRSSRHAPHSARPGQRQHQRQAPGGIQRAGAQDRVLHRAHGEAPDDGRSPSTRPKLASCPDRPDSHCVPSRSTCAPTLFGASFTGAASAWPG